MTLYLENGTPGQTSHSPQTWQSLSRSELGPSKTVPTFAFGCSTLTRWPAIPKAESESDGAANNKIMRFDDKDADELDGVRRDDRASYPDPWAMVTRDQKIIVGEVPLHYAAHAPVPSSA
jgi:hypothetical protein